MNVFSVTPDWILFLFGQYTKIIEQIKEKQKNFFQHAFSFTPLLIFRKMFPYTCLPKSVVCNTRLC